MNRPHIRIAEDIYIELWPDASHPHLTIVNDMGYRGQEQQRVIVFRDEIESFQEAFGRAAELLNGAIGVWYNYQTGEYDCLPDLPETDEDAEKYIPQGGGIDLYRLLRKKGYGIVEAIIRVLRVAIDMQSSSGTDAADE